MIVTRGLGLPGAARKTWAAQSTPSASFSSGSGASQDCSWHRELAREIDPCSFLLEEMWRKWTPIAIRAGGQPAEPAEGSAGAGVGAGLLRAPGPAGARSTPCAFNDLVDRRRGGEAEEDEDPEEEGRAGTGRAAAAPWRRLVPRPAGALERLRRESAGAALSAGPSAGPSGYGSHSPGGASCTRLPPLEGAGAGAARTPLRERARGAGAAFFRPVACPAAADPMARAALPPGAA
eukprot:tig00021127_g18783.t1